MIHPRKYQSEGRENIKTCLKDNHKQIIWTGATGSGKTIIGADITARAVKKGIRVLWLVHREEILNQTIKKLVMFGLNPGIIQGKEYMKDSSVHVAMVQTLSKRLDFLMDNNILPQIIISDECHHGTANTWLKIFHTIKEKNKHCAIIGLTASPIRTDGIGLNTAGYTALINGPQYIDLLDTNYTKEKIYLSEPVVIYSPLTAILSRAKGKKKRKDYDPNEEDEIFGDRIVVNNAVDLYNKYFCGAPCIFFCASINDCFEVTSSMQAEGWKGGSVFDKMDTLKRKDFIDGLGDGRYNFICSYDILGEGVDIPVVAGCIKRRRTMSLGIEIQQNGRGARLYPGKKYNLIVDQCGNSLIHGHPLVRREWSLEGINKMEKEDEIKNFVCLHCGAQLFIKSKTCPYCGETLKGETFEDVTIREVQAPMSILSAPVQLGTNEFAEIQEYDENDRDDEIQTRIKNGHFSSFDRFGELAKMLGKDDKWTSLIWKKYHA